MVIKWSWIFLAHKILRKPSLTYSTEKTLKLLKTSMRFRSSVYFCFWNNRHKVPAAGYHVPPKYSLPAEGVEDLPDMHLSHRVCRKNYKENDGDDFREPIPSAATDPVIPPPQSDRLPAAISNYDKRWRSPNRKLFVVR